MAPPRGTHDRARRTWASSCSTARSPVTGSARSAPAAVHIDVQLRLPFDDARHEALRAAADRHGAFLGLPADGLDHRSDADADMSKPHATEGRVSLLRGINVGGNHQIPMARLRELYGSLGFEEVETYIQSGNVTFRARPAARTAPRPSRQRSRRRSAGPSASSSGRTATSRRSSPTIPSHGRLGRNGWSCSCSSRRRAPSPTEFGRVVAGDDEAILRGPRDPPALPRTGSGGRR